MGLPGRSLHLLALPPLLPPVKGDHPRGRVLLPGGHHPGLHLPRPGGGPHHQQQHQPAQLPDRQPEAAAGVAARARGGWLQAGMLGAAQQHHEVPAAARPFMCAQPVLAIQTPAFMVGSSSSSKQAGGSSSSTGTQHAVQQQTLLLLCCSLHPAAVASSPALSWLR